MRGERRSSLTPREREVLALVRVGLTNEEIAGRLGISPDTAKYHVSQILAKLGVATREEAAALAMPEERGWWQRLGAWGLAAKLGLVAAAVVVLAGMGLLAWAVASTGAGDSAVVLEATGTATATPTPSGPTAVPWVDSTQGPTRSPEPSPTIDPSNEDIRPCQASDLVAAYLNGGAATAMRFETFGFSNISSDECRLKGTPVVRLLDSSGSLEDWDVSRCEESTTAKCLEVDAILPTGAPTPTHLGGGVPGQAVLVLNWDRCDLPAAQCNCTSDVASIAIDLPSDGGNFTIPFDAPHSFCGGIFVEQFKPAVRPTPVPGSQPELTATLKLPPTIESGSILYYDVQLTNVSTSAPWAFGDPCPNYNAFVGEHIGPGFQSLNCRPAIAIQPGGTVDFAMQMDIPADTEPGDYPVYWTFFDGQSAIPAGGFDVEHPGPKYWITVTAP